MGYASFTLSEVKLGLLPATIAPFVVARIGASAARRYFLTAELFGGGQHSIVAGMARNSLRRMGLESFERIAGESWGEVRAGGVGARPSIRALCCAELRGMELERRAFI